jgi:hypothetical protein
VKKILFCLIVSCSSIAFAQQHFFYGLQMDYGYFNRSFEANRDIIKGKNMGRMLNLRLSASYRVFDQLTFEAGMSLNGMKWKLQDMNFKERNPGFEALMATQNRFMSFYGNTKYSFDLGRKKYAFIRLGYEFSAIGKDQLSANKLFVLGNDVVDMTFNYGSTNKAIVPEIGYEYFNSSGNLICFGLKYHHKFAGDNFITGDYHVTTPPNINIYDRVTVNGSYIALTAQFNGLLSYKAKKERVKKEKVKPIEPKDTIKKPVDKIDPVIVDEIPIDTSKKVAIDDKKANERDYVVTNKMKVTSKTVKITVWDHQIEDGDRINLILNDDWVLTDYTLENKKYTIEVTLKEGENKLILYALNLGRYKPNTAAIMVDDGTKKQEVVLQSTLEESSAIEIKFEK